MKLNIVYQDKKNSFEVVDELEGFKKLEEQAKSLVKAKDGDISMSFNDVDGDQVPIVDNDDFEYLLARVKENEECNKIELKVLGGAEEEAKKEEPKNVAAESFFDVAEQQGLSFVNLSKMNSVKTKDNNNTFVNIDGDDNLDTDFIKVSEVNVSIKDKEVKDKQKAEEERLRLAEEERLREVKEAEEERLRLAEEERLREVKEAEERKKRQQEEAKREIERRRREELEAALLIQEVRKIREEEEAKRVLEETLRKEIEEAEKKQKEEEQRKEAKRRLKEEALAMEREMQFKQAQEELDSLALEQRATENINFIGDISEIHPVKIEKPFESFQHLNFNKKQSEQTQQLEFIDDNNVTLVNESLDEIITKNTKIDNINAKLENLDESIDQKLALFKTELMDHIKANAVVKKKSSRKTSKIDVVHIGVRCNNCDRQNFKGRRYKCLVCDDFDLCEKCEDKTAHPHPMVRFTKRDLERKGTTLYKLNNILESGKSIKEDKVKENFLRAITNNQYDNNFYTSLVKKYKKFVMGDFVSEIIRIFD